MTHRVWIIALAALMPLAATAQDTVSFASYGGAYQEAIRKAILDPAEKDHDIKVQEYSIAGGIADIRAKVQAKANEFDVVELYAGQCAQAVEEDLVVPLDYSVITNAGGIPEELRTGHYIGFTAYSTVLAWNTEVYGENHPRDWADFFDTESYPGPRAISSVSPSVNLEVALLADGVARDSLYPLDVDRGLNKLRELMPEVAVMWTTGAQATQLAQTQEVDMLTIWAARIDAAIKEGAPFDYTYQDGIMDVECLVVPKHSPNPEGAMRLINMLIDPEYQANLPKYIPYGPMNVNAFETGKITDEMAAKVITSPENLEKHVILDKEYWAEHGQELQERWDAFRLE